MSSQAQLRSNTHPGGTPFADFAPSIRPRTPLRQLITAAYRQPEPECLQPLLEGATLPETMRLDIRDTARKLITALRAKHTGSGV